MNFNCVIFEGTSKPFIFDFNEILLSLFVISNKQWIMSLISIITRSKQLSCKSLTKFELYDWAVRHSSRAILLFYRFLIFLCANIWNHTIKICFNSDIKISTCLWGFKLIVLPIFTLVNGIIPVVFIV